MAQLLAEDRPYAANVAPLIRPRLLDRLRLAKQFPVTLLVAPAGYGKSVLLRQFLETLPEPTVRFSLRSEHAEFLSFLRGFAEALGEFAPHAITSLAGAYERNQASSRRAQDLARWMRAHLDESFSGTIAIDDLHNGDADPDITVFLTELVAAWKGRVSWVLASRSSSGLPVASWLAYGDADLPIGEADLRFTLFEAADAAAQAGSKVGPGEMRNLLHITEGWPAALTFALRTSTRSDDLRNVAAVTRDMIYGFLAEQVYNSLHDDERALLEVAIVLPSIDVAVLERAGFDRALHIVEELRERTAFISEESPGVYHCHDLFRDFLRHQNALNGKRAQQKTNERAARALESSGDIEHAIAAYIGAGSRADLLRLLEAHGFDLLERAHSDIVTKAINALHDSDRRENPRVLSIMGAIQASEGRFSRADALLKRALARGNDRSLVASVSLRLATLHANAGLDVYDLLEPIAEDKSQTVDTRAEAMSLMVARRLLYGGKGDYLRYVKRIESLLPAVTHDQTRVKVLHHLGIVKRHTHELGVAIELLHRASDLSHELHMYGIAARVNAVLSNLMLQEYDDDLSQLKFSEIAARNAARAGDVPTLRTALLQNVSAHVRKGDDEAVQRVLERLSGIPLDGPANHLIMFFRAVALSWHGRFREAHALMSSSWRALYLDIDRATAGAQLALFLASDGLYKESSDIVRQVRPLLCTAEARGPFRSRAIALSTAYVAVAEALNGKETVAMRIARTIKTNDDIEEAAYKFAETFIKMLGEARLPSIIKPNIEALERAGYWDASRTLAAVCAVAERAPTRKTSQALTNAEVDVLRMLAAGIVPKEIAADTHRSINTVRAHISSATTKLHCNRQSEAVKLAQRMGLI